MNEFWEKYEQLYWESSNLNEDDAKTLEDAIVKDPDDLEKRVKLIAFYSRALEETALIPHGLWLMKSHPQAPIFFYYVYPPFHEGKNAYFEAEQVWLENIDKFPTDTNVLKNATMFLALMPEKIDYIRNRVTELCPDDKSAWIALFLCRLGALTILDPGERRKQAKSNLLLLEKIEPMERSSKNVYGFPLYEASLCAYYSGDISRAEAYSRETLNIVEWPTGVRLPDEHQKAYNMLGLCALSRNDKAVAETWLEKSSSIVFDPETIPWMYPHIELAEELLYAGSAEAVCRFVECYPEATINHYKAEELVKRIKSGDLWAFSKESALYIARDAITLLKAGKHDRSRQLLQKLIPISHRSPYTYYNIGFVAAGLGETGIAVNSFVQALTMLPSLSEELGKSKVSKLVIDDSRLKAHLN